MKIKAFLLGAVVHRTESKTLSESVGGCSNDKSQYTCKTNCSFKSTQNGYKLMFQGNAKQFKKYVLEEISLLELLQS